MKDLQIEPLTRCFKLNPISLLHKWSVHFKRISSLKKITLKLDKMKRFVFQPKHLNFIKPLEHEKQNLKSVGVNIKRQNIQLNPIINLKPKP